MGIPEKGILTALGDIIKEQAKSQGLFIGNMLKTILLLEGDKAKIDAVSCFAQALIDSGGGVNEAIKKLQEHLRAASDKIQAPLQ